ncbi:MAG: hypothetical protein AAFS11_01120 [Planctomycetota bacterium]
MATNSTHRAGDFEYDDERLENDFDLTDPQLLADRLEDLMGLDDPEPAGPKMADSEMRQPGEDRRKNVVGESPTGLERRRGPGRRLTDFVKSAEEGEMSSEQFLFLRAIETFKEVNGKSYPNWTDVLEVIRLLGYRKVQASELNLPNVTDWQEKADSPSNVRDRQGVSHRRKTG